jgi:hypothetical protein
LDLSWVGLDPSVQHQVTKYLPLANFEDSLLGVEPKSCIAHVGECYCEVSEVILFVFACDDDVVYVGENVVAYLTLEDPLGEARKG